MNTLNRKATALACLAAGLLLAAPAFAANIPINDPSFEASGTFGFITGGNWQITQGSANNFAPTVPTQFSSIPNGSKVAALAADPSDSNIFQGLFAYDLLADTTYTLSVDVAYLVGGNPFSYNISLLAGGFLTGTASLPALTAGNWGTATYVYNTADPLISGHIGNNLAIDINLTDTVNAGYFDNVRLTAVSNAAPEPGSVFLLLGGIPAAFAFRKLRRIA